MVAILEDYPRVKANINLVPSLLVQLDEYSKGIAKDKFLDLTLKPVLELSDDENKALSDGYILICVNGFSLGFGKLSKGIIKNKYLPGWRMM